MKSLFCSALFLLTFSQNAQSPTAVAVKDEPHHHLVLENSYVRVFRVSIPANDATLLHQHDSPYLFVALGPADFTNAVAGKPEVEAKLADGQVGYSRGGFAHIARTDHGLPFNNVTVELLHPQGDPHNLCVEVVPNAPTQSCEKTVTEKKYGTSRFPLFQTDETEVSIAHHDPEINQVGFTPSVGTLFILLSGSGVHIVAKDQTQDTLEIGQVLWLVAGTNTNFTNPSGKAWSYLTLGFKGSEALHKY